MNEFVGKKEEKKSQSVAHAVSKHPKSVSPSFSLTDNRSQSITQRKLYESIPKSNEPIQLGKRSSTEAFGEDASSDFEPPKKKRKISGEQRLHRTYLRNRRRKAIPKKRRSAFGRQKLHNYGYGHKDIEFGSVKGNFYKGPFVNQPYLRIKKEDYGLSEKPKTNYDDIIKGLEKYKDDAALANLILNKIKKGTELPKKMNNTVKANASLLIQLTQFIEPHETRVPGIDKLARSFLKQIANGAMTFKQVFNRKNGLFVVARAKSGGSKYGGQEAGRTLVKMPPKKSDKAKRSEIWSNQIDNVAAEMSESSSEESSDDESSSDD